MYIKNVVLESHVSAYCPNEYSATLTIDGINAKQAQLIGELYHTGQDIHIIPQDKRCSNNDTRLKDVFMNYCANDVNVTRETLAFSELWKLKNLKVVKVIYNKPATIVFWSDNTKTVVKCEKKDKYDPEKGFFIACAKKLFGNDYRAVGRMNKALELAVDTSKNAVD